MHSINTSDISHITDCEQQGEYLVDQVYKREERGDALQYIGGEEMGDV